MQYKRVCNMDIPNGRKSKKQVALRPQLAEAFRNLSRMERRELSDVFKEMFLLWLKKAHRRGKYVDFHLDKEA